MQCNWSGIDHKTVMMSLAVSLACSCLAWFELKLNLKINFKGNLCKIQAIECPTLTPPIISAYQNENDTVLYKFNALFFNRLFGFQMY